MKEFVYLAAVAVYLATMVSVAHSEECPKYGTVNISHPTDCAYYSKCYMGKPFNFTCGLDDAGRQLCFVEGQRSCGWYDNCYCLHCKSREDNHKWPDPSDEGAYYQCNNGLVKQKHCFKDEVFDPTILECHKKNNNGTDKCSTSGEQYPHHCLCEKYYECKNGNKIVQDCQDGLLFDADLLICRDSRDARCNHHPGWCSRDGIFPDSNSCYYYYKCKNGVKTSHKCNYGMIFDKNRLVCVNWDQGNCDGNDYTTPHPNSCNWERQRKPNLNDCNRYYECINGYVEDSKCLENHYFNNITLLCDLWKNVDCKNKNNGGHDPGGNTGDCPTVDCGKVRYPHKICGWYYECQNGIKETMRCASGLAYNRYSETCDLPQNVKCSTKVCLLGSLHPHDCQCDKYYICGRNGEKILSDCPDGKQFDEVTLNCVPYGQAKCHKGHKRASFNQNV